MATHKSALKAHRRSLKRRERNISVISRIKTFIKKFELSLGAEKSEDKTAAFRKAESEIMRGVSKGVLKKNTAARKVSKFARLLKESSAA
jgi:small subunit ribosomal protein S20